MEIEVPVSPYIGTIKNVDDVVLSLLGIAPLEKIRFQKPADQTFQYTTARLESGQVSLETLINSGVNTAITVANNFKGDIHCYNVALNAQAKVDNTLQDSIVKSAKYSIGFRMDVLAFNVKNEAKVAVPSLLAASATLNLASSLYQVVVLGAGIEALPFLKPILLASTADFNVQTFEALGSAEDELQRYIAENHDSLTPSIETVTIDAKMLTDLLFPGGKGKYTDDTLAQTYAFERAFHGASLNDAKKDGRVDKNNLNKAIIDRVYRDILGLGPDQKPTDAAKKICETVLHTGRY